MVMMEETYHQMEAEDGEATSGAAYSNVLEKSTLRPDVEPFVPKMPGAPGFLMMGQSPFSLDAPEFVPAYYTGGDMYSWAPAPNQFLVQTVNHPRLLIPRFRRKYIGQQQRNNRGGTYRNGNNRFEEGSEGHEERGNFRNYNNNKEVDRKYTRSEERSTHDEEGSTHDARRGARSYSNSRHQKFNNGKASNNENKPRPQRVNGTVEIHPSEAVTIASEHKLLAPEMSQQSEQSPVSYNEGPEVVENSVYPPVLSYRAALVGKAAKSVTGSDKPEVVPTDKVSTPVENKTERTESEWIQVERKREEKATSGEEKEGEKVGEKTEITRWESRDDERRARGAPAFRGRPKPTRGSGIQLNIFSMIQVSEDKKGKKKKLAASKVKGGPDCQKLCNSLDSTGPSARRGKETEGGKSKKLSKMKKIIVKEKEDKAEPTVLNGKAPYGRLHTRQFREYCAQVVTEDLNTSLATFLSRLREFNDRAYKQGSTRRRYCCGLREAEKYLKLKKVRCLVIPPNIEKIVTKGGLDDCVSDIITLSRDQDIPIFFGLNKTLISKLLARPKSTITSAVSIFNYDGAEDLWKDVQDKASLAKDIYQRLAEEGQEESSSSSEGEEFDEDNNEDEVLTLDESQTIQADNNPEADESTDSHPKFDSDVSNLSHCHLNGTDNESVSSSFIDSGIENGMISEISSMSLDNGVITDEGERSTDGER